MNIIPTRSAIATAVRNAQRDGGNYNLNDLLAAEGLWMVSHKSGDRSRSYVVDTVNEKCECEAFRKTGVCKHQVMVDEEISIRAREEELEASEEAAFFMAECQREQFAEIAGAWN